jgi:predicted DsbA family dithiol-disulfide isomerase
MIFTRRIFSIAAMAGGLALAACGDGGASDGRTEFEREGDFAKGSSDAPITMVEYASTACPHCASFHEQAMPTVEDYVESGDVRLVFREMITGQPQLAVAGFMLARCAPEDRYFDVIDLLFEQQEALFTAMQQGEAQAQFRNIARSAGFSDEEFQSCLSNEEVLQAVQDAHARAQEDGVTGTPAFFFNGVKLDTERAGDGSGLVFAMNGQPLEDEEGVIPAAFDGDTFERIILHLSDRAESANGG